MRTKWLAIGGVLLLAILVFGAAGYSVEGTIADQVWYVPSSQLVLGAYVAPHGTALASGYQIADPFQINMIYQAGILDDDITNINTYLYPYSVDFPPNHTNGTWTLNYSDNDQYVFTIDEAGGLPVYTYTGAYPAIVPVNTPGIQWTLTAWGQTVLAGDIVEQGGNTYFRVYPEATYRPFDNDPPVNNVEVFSGNLKTQVHGYTFAGSLGSVGDGSTLTCEIAPVVGLPPFPVHNATQNTYYLTIQSAIDAADSGDTINVTAGTYNESFIYVFNKALTILGARSATTIIDGGNATGIAEDGNVRLENRTTSGTTTFSGFTIQNAASKSGNAVGIVVLGEAGTGVVISDVKIVGLGTTDMGLYVFANFGTLDFGNSSIIGCGSNPILLERQLGASRIHHNTLINNSAGIYVMTPEEENVTTLQKIDNNTIVTDGSASGIAFATAMFWNGHKPGRFDEVEISDNTISGLGASKYGISLSNQSNTDGMDAEIGRTGVIITGNTISGSGAADSYGIKLQGLISNVIVSNNGVSGMETGFWSQEDTYSSPTTSPTGVTVTGNDITGNSEGIAVQSTIAPTFHFNNIYGNSVYGINNYGTGSLDAEDNWWGDASGPYHATLNSAGLGDPVSDNVDFDPWTGMATGTVVWDPVVAPGDDPVVNPDAGVSVTIESGTGTTGVIIAEYTAPPAGTPSFGAGTSYVDVQIDNPSGITELTIDFGGMTSEDVIYFYLPGTGWVVCSSQVYAAGTITVTVTASTVPTLAQLTGTVFAAGTVTGTALGNINGDSVIDVLDVRLCLQIAQGDIMGNAAQRNAADVDGDSDVDMDDARILAEYVIGIRVTLP